MQTNASGMGEYEQGWMGTNGGGQVQTRVGKRQANKGGSSKYNGVIVIVIVIFIIFIIDILWGILISQVLDDTVTNTVWYVPVPKTDMVYVGTGTVLKFLTHSIPVASPTQSFVLPKVRKVML